MSPTESPQIPSDTSDGSTELTDGQKKYTEQLGDGSRTGRATTDPRQDTDAASGGEPAKPDEVDLENGTDAGGTPVENPAG